ncbi:MAG TPA: hypothetical protein VK348_11905 [Planctomycetota bacterium]|nr:hypothetical protein [Planctomycetota bacterium]
MTPAPGPGNSNPLLRILRGCASVVLAIWIFLEEWIWDVLTVVMAMLSRLPPVRWLEGRIARLSPYPAMTVYLLPVLLLLPAKILGLWLIGTGHVTTGLLVFVLAKVTSTALVARLFALTRPALLTVGWFRRLYFWFIALRDRVYAYVKSLRAWQVAKAFTARIKAAVRAFRGAGR